MTVFLELKDQLGLSYQDFSDVAGGTACRAGKSTIERFFKGELKNGMNKTIRRNLGKNLPEFLLSRGMNPQEINNILSGFFNQGEFQKMVTQRVKLSPTAQKWFGLNSDPFEIKLNQLSDVFISPQLQEIHDSIIDAITYQGFVAVVGDIGSGKTVLRSWIEESIQRSNNSLELIFPENFEMAKITPSSIARAILEHFNYQRIPIDGGSKTRAVKRLLAERSKTQKIAIAFDECHKLNPTTLSSLKNFLEMNSGGFQRYLGIILLGQPSFTTNLTESREIAERLNIIEMPEFQQSAAAYLAHRLALVGGNASNIFDDDAINIIAANSATPLQLGNITNKAMAICMSEPFESQKVLGSIIDSQMHLPKKLSKKLKAVS